MAKNCTCKVVAFLNKPISFFGVLVAVAVVVAKAPWAVEPPESDHPKCEGLRKSNQGWTNGRLKKYLIPEDTVNFLFQILNTVEPLLWDTSIQGTAPFRGLKIWSRKNVHRIFVFVTSTEGILLFRGKKHFFWVPKPGFNFHSGNTLALKKVKNWLTTIIVDTVFRSVLLSYGDSFQIMNHLT